MHTAKVTVLMPVYNTAAYLKQAIDSILAQTFTDFEFLIIDDASTDGSVDIIKAYADPRIQLIQKPENTGYTNSLNMGLNLAKGEYIARMDSDDISLPNRFARQVAFMDAHPEVGVCGTLVEFIGAREGIEEKETESHRIKNILFRTNQFCHPSIFIRTSVLRENNLYFDPALEPAEDYAFWVRLSRVSDLRNIAERLVKYRIHPHQVSMRWSKEQSAVFDHVRLQQVRELGIDYSDEEAQLHLALLKGNLLVTASHLIKAYHWIVRLYRHNEKKQLFDCSLFREQLYRDWERIVGNISDYNLALAGIALYGELPFFSLLPAKQKITFLLKCFVQWKTRV